MTEPVIEELGFDFNFDDKPYTLVITPDQYLYLCSNKKCISNILVEKKRCPLCGDKIHKYNKIGIDDKFDYE